MTTENQHDEPCQCELCVMARMAKGPDIGPKEPRDDDDDSDDDSDDDAAELCECEVCRPKPVPTGDALTARLHDYVAATVENSKGSARYGADVTRELAKEGMPAEVETIMLQYAVDMWNAADRCLCDIARIMDRHEPGWNGGTTLECAAKTLDDARAYLARMRANRPRRKGHDYARRIRLAVERMLDERVAGAVGVKVGEL